MRPAHVLLAVLLIPLCALAQPDALPAPAAPPPPIVESVGEATVQGAPTHVTFWLHREASSPDSMADAMTLIEGFESAVRAGLAERGLGPTETEVTPPQVVDVSSRTVRASARLRFLLAPIVASETALQDFAALCDALNDLAAAVSGAAAGPSYETTDKESLSQAAVTRATENAYTTAEAVARSLGATIYAVDSATVAEVAWNQTEDSRMAVPNLRQVTCTARVKVVYTVDTPQV